jgi:hypothetical protein
MNSCPWPHHFVYEAMAKRRHPTSVKCSSRSRNIGAARPHLGHGQVGRRWPCSSSQIGVNLLRVATARPGGQDEAKEASGMLTPHGENRCCWSRSSRLPASRRRCTCNHTCCRLAGRAGVVSARGSLPCSGGRRGLSPLARQSCLPYPHSRPRRRRECVVRVVGPDGWGHLGRGPDGRLRGLSPAPGLGEW